MRLCFIVICVFVCLNLVETLLDQSPISNGQTDHLVLELQRNFSTFQHEMELQLSLLKQKYTIEILVQNQTITAQRQKILELEQKQKSSVSMITEQNKNITNLEKKVEDQDKKIVMLENILNYNITNLDRKNNVLEQTVDSLKLSQNAAINITTVGGLEEIHIQQQQKISEIEGRLNQSFGSYEVILHDVVDKQNLYAATYTNQIRTLNESAALLNKQFHYLALSVQDAEKKTNLLNATLNRKSMKSSSILFFLCPCITNAIWISANIILFQTFYQIEVIYLVMYFTERIVKISHFCRNRVMHLTLWEIHVF